MVSRYMVAVLIIIVINYLNSVIFPIQLFFFGGDTLWLLVRRDKVVKCKMVSAKFRT